MPSCAALARSTVTSAARAVSSQRLRRHARGAAMRAALTEGTASAGADSEGSAREGSGRAERGGGAVTGGTVAGCATGAATAAATRGMRTARARASGTTLSLPDQELWLGATSGAAELSSAALATSSGSSDSPSSDAGRPLSAMQIWMSTTGAMGRLPVAGGGGLLGRWPCVVLRWSRCAPAGRTPVEVGGWWMELGCGPVQLPTIVIAAISTSVSFTPTRTSPLSAASRRRRAGHTGPEKERRHGAAAGRRPPSLCKPSDTARSGCGSRGAGAVP